jgi:hypothetical protein
MGFKSRKNKSKSKSNKINKKRCKVTRKKRCKVTRKMKGGVKKKGDLSSVKKTPPVMNTKPKGPVKSSKKKSSMVVEEQQQSPAEELTMAEDEDMIVEQLQSAAEEEDMIAEKHPQGPAKEAQSMETTEVVEPLPNRRRFISLDSILYVDGADFESNPLYSDLTRQMSLEKDPEKLEKFKQIITDVNLRAGLLRNENGIFVSHDLPKSNEKFDILMINKLLKFVVVINNETQKYMILWIYARTKNFNYVNDYLIKWIDRNMDSGELYIRETAKEVVLITPEIISEIEENPDFAPSLVNGNLLLTRSFKPETYDAIIYEYFSRSGNDMTNIVAACPIYEMPHSGIATHYPYKGKLKTTEDRSDIAVLAGLEGVFYYNEEGKLCFVIGNISGHFRTPKDRMDFIKNTLETYGYTNIHIIEDPRPSSPPSSIDSNDSDAPREEYRRFITNDPNITTFEAAVARLEAADVTPVEVPMARSFSHQDKTKAEVKNI